MSVDKVLDILRDFIPLVTTWPIIVLILALWFQRQIKNLIASVYEARIGSNVFVRFWQFRLDARGPDVRASEALSGPAAAKQITPSGAKLENVASLFWLGNDLEWTSQTVLRGAPKDRILHGLKQCYHHISEIGLAQSAPGQQLLSLNSQVADLQQGALDREWRSNFAENIYVVIRQISDLLRGDQPGFRPSPE
jgi:hypothetical protein